MPLKVLPAHPSDAELSCKIENLAYGPNPIGAALFPGPFPSSPTRADHLRSQRAADSHCRWTKVIDTDLPEDENMIAFSMWYFWDTPQPEAKAEEWGQGMNGEACELFFGGMMERRNARFGGKPFAYLKLLHTHPDHQRRGAGSMLLKWGAEEADRLGLDSYLESSPEGKGLYEKCGFEELETFVVDFSKWDGPKEHASTLMSRPAGKKA